MKLNQKTLVGLLIAAIVVLALVFVYTSKNSSSQQPYQSGQQSQTGTSAIETIQNDSELMSASNELNDTNIDGTLNPGLNQTSADAQTL